MTGYRAPESSRYALVQEQNSAIACHANTAAGSGGTRNWLDVLLDQLVVAAGG